METQVATTGNTLPAVPAGSWGSEGTSSEDLVIPRINLQHDLSQAVKSGKARPGDFMHSNTQEVLPKSIEFIPVKTFRQWLITDALDRKKMLGKILVDKNNEDWPEQGTMNGKEVLRTKTLNFFVLLPGRLEELPFLVSFKKSGMYAGKILSTHFQTSAMRNMPPAAHTFLLSSEQRVTNGNQYMSPVVSPGRLTTADELAVAYKWYQILSKGDVKVEEEGSEAVPF